MKNKRFHFVLSLCVCEKCEYAFSVSTRRCVVRAQAWCFEAQLTGVMYGDVSSIVALLPRCVEPSMVASDCTYTVVVSVYDSVVRVVRRRGLQQGGKARAREGGRDREGAERRPTGRPEGGVDWDGSLEFCLGAVRTSHFPFSLPLAFRVSNSPCRKQNSLPLPRTSL